MKLILNNLGKLHNETEIQFDGITILAGDNGSGKSTISKALYCMFQGFYDIDNKIRRDREREIANIILSGSVPKGNGRRVQSLSGGFINQLIDDYAEEESLQTIIDRINRTGVDLVDGLSIMELAQKIEQTLYSSRYEKRNHF